MKKFFGAMLCLCLLIGILATTAFATNITIFNVTVRTPKTGEPLSYEASVPKTASTYVSKVEWSGELDAEGKATYGDYEVRVTVRIRDGMDDKYIKAPVKDTVKVNGKSAKLKDISQDKKQAVVVYTFHIEDTRTDHEHCYCGGYIENTGDHTAHQTTGYKRWPGEKAIKYKNGVACIYLDKDVQLDNTLNIGGGKTLYLCLNGHALAMKYRGQRVINVGAKGTLYLCNCTRSASGKITNGEAEYGAGIHNSGTVRMYGGVITKNNGGYGGGVHNNVNFYLYGGDIYDNKAISGGGVWNNDSSSTFIMYNGTIGMNVASSGSGIWNNGGGKVVLKGGTINKNAAGTGGGGLWNNGGTVELDGTMLLENIARYGGGIWNNGGGILEIKSGNVSKNIAGSGVADKDINGYGGGVWNNEKGIIRMTGGEITFNKAAFGGGVWSNPDSDFWMSNGVIAENLANYGGGIYISAKGSHVATYTKLPPPGRFRITDKAGVVLNTGAVQGGGAFVEGFLEFEGEAEITGNIAGTPDNINIYTAEGGKVTRGVPMPTPFVDVARNAYYVEPVKWAVEKKITSGTTDFTFSPDNACNTAQILTFLWRAAGSPTVTDPFPFADVYEKDYFYMAAQWARKKGLIDHYAIYPNFGCTRMTAVYYIWCAAGKPACKVRLRFTDTQETKYEKYYEAIAWAVDNGITSGTSDTTFSPGKSCTRAQIVTFLQRASQKGLI